MNLKRILNYFKVCLKDWSISIGLFWGFFGAGSIFAIIDILFKYRNYLFLFIFFYYPSVIFLPFIIYINFYENTIKVNKKQIVHMREEGKLLNFEIISLAETKSSFRFKVGEKIDTYYLFFSKIPDIDMNFSLPNKTKFKQISRSDREFYVIKCKNKYRTEFYLTINSLNLNKKSSIQKFHIYYSKENSLKKAKLKKSCILKYKIHCAP